MTSKWFLIIALVVIVYVIVRGGDDKFASSSSQLNYDRMAVSQGMTAAASDLDLEKDLDVSLLPDIGKQVIREAAQRGLQKQAFLENVVQEVGNRVRQISTIDLNDDGKVDPILVKPEPVEGEQYILLSLRVPAPAAYPLPAAGDTSGWKKVEQLEVATMTVAFDEKALTVQAQGNKHVYPNSGGNQYVAHDRTSSFLQMYIGMRMMQWMFYPRYYGFYGPGYGYGMYRPMGVAAVRSSRGAAVSRYSSSSASRSSAIRSRSGAAPTSQYSRTYSKQSPKSLNQVRSNRSFQRRQAAATRSGGFGRSTSRGSTAARSRSFAPRASGSRFGGFGRGFGRSSFGGGGFRFGK